MAEGKRNPAPKILTFRPQAIWRIHPARFRPAEFRSGTSSNARFGPIKSAGGVVIPTWYGARTVACAMMETVLHDVPAPPTDYILDIDGLRVVDLSPG